MQFLSPKNRQGRHLFLIDMWEQLPANLRGAIFMLLGALGFSCMAFVIKIVGRPLSETEPGLNNSLIVFARCFFGLLILLPVIYRSGPTAVLRTNRIWLHLQRGLIGFCALTTFIYAISFMPLADVTAMSFAKPLFVIILAVLFLGEKVRWRRWAATMVGFVGVLIMIRPGQTGFDPNVLFAVLGALLVAGAVVTMKILSRSESVLTILTYFGITSTLFALIPALLNWQWPSLAQLGLLLLIGILGVGSQSFLVRAYAAGEATFVAPFDYIRLIYAGGLGYLFFSEIPDIWTLAGALLIVISTLYIARREAVLARQNKMADSADAVTEEKRTPQIQPGDGVHSRKI